MARERSLSSQQQNCMRFLCSFLPVVFLLAIPSAARPYEQTPLTTGFYGTSCPNLQETVKTALYKEMQAEWRIGASLMRLMFHDCFVHGCDGSVFLDDTATTLGEKQALANNRSLRGFEAFDRIKAAVEGVCPGVVSCADTINIVARDAVVANGGPWWDVELGRRDSLSASFESANTTLPLAFNDVSTLISLFKAQGLDKTDLVALTGAHTFGKAQCPTFTRRLYNFQNTGGSDPSMDPAYVALLKAVCPEKPTTTTTTTVDLDPATPTSFDNSYYSNLVMKKGLLTSDQTLQADNKYTARMVNNYAKDQNQFFKQFSSSITKMGRISPLTGSAGEIRCNCRKANS